MIPRLVELLLLLMIIYGGLLGIYQGLTGAKTEASTRGPVEVLTGCLLIITAITSLYAWYHR